MPAPVLIAGFGLKAGLAATIGAKSGPVPEIHLAFGAELSIMRPFPSLRGWASGSSTGLGEGAVNALSSIKLGMVSEACPSRAKPAKTTPDLVSLSDSDERRDYFVRRDGACYAGSHLIIDLWGAARLDDLDHVEAALRDAVDATGATLLHIHLHHFTPNGGISGVAVLAESHISIHTWPERDYAALDVFMCGDAEPEKSIAVFDRAFAPETIDVNTLRRGEQP